MKLQIHEWQKMVGALHLAEETERKRCDLARRTNDTVESKRAYISAEGYMALREKIEQENLG